MTAPTTLAFSSSLPLTAENAAALPLILLVDDARIMRVVLQETLEQQGYEIMVAESGEDAVELLDRHAARIDAVVLDREMPGIDGMEVVRLMKQDRRLGAIPVIMLTGTDAPDKIQEGIDAGVYYYLVKPTGAKVLKSVIDAALRARRQSRNVTTERDRHGDVLGHVANCQLSVRTLQDAAATAGFIAACFPRPDQVSEGLMELLVNAVEHGNLGVGYEGKRRLLAEGTWRDEVDRRATLPENAGKCVTVTFQRKDGNCLAQITDAGPGFDWKSFWHINPARATASHGRGISRARLTAFDAMSYNEAGNSVTVMVRAAAAEQKDYAW